MSIVRFENVTKQFGTDAYGIKSITFRIDPGEFVFMTGPSGSGKTTIMRLLLKEYDYSDGEIYFHDDELTEIPWKRVHLHRRKIGVVFQDYKLIPELNIWENIALPLSVMGKKEAEIEQRVTDLLNLIKLPEKALQFPSQLSGGEAQRVGIARALAVGPEIVIADEPTGNLDPETAQNIARLLKKINELGTTVIIATHDRNILSKYPEHRVLRLERGELVADTAASDSTVISVVTKTAAPKQAPEAQTTTTPDEPKSSAKTDPKVKKPSWFARFFSKKPKVETAVVIEDLEDDAAPPKKETETAPEQPKKSETAATEKPKKDTTTHKVEKKPAPEKKKTSTKETRSKE